MHRGDVKRLAGRDCSFSNCNSQDGFPIRIKAVNIINEPRIFKGIFAIIKPFLKEKMAERVTSVLGFSHFPLVLLLFSARAALNVHLNVTNAAINR